MQHIGCWPLPMLKALCLELALQPLVLHLQPEVALFRVVHLVLPILLAAAVLSLCGLQLFVRLAEFL